MTYYEIIRMHKQLLQYMQQYNGKVEDVNLLDVYAEYKALTAEGNKKEYIFAVIKEKYNLGKTAVVSMAAKMEQICI